LANEQFLSILSEININTSRPRQRPPAHPFNSIQDQQEDPDNPVNYIKESFNSIQDQPNAPVAFALRRVLSILSKINHICPTPFPHL